jgi:N6-adenosine-specific RNA methylase IME4
MLKAAEMHYPTMPTAEIAAQPVPDITARDAVLFMWAVSAMLPDALDVVKARGFEYKTFAVWVKPHIGCGHWFRGQHEALIVATRGDMPPPPELRSSVFTGTALRRHSTKPVEVRDWISAAYPRAGKVELFCRGTPGPGWATWGFEAQAAA